MSIFKKRSRQDAPAGTTTHNVLGARFDPQRVHAEYSVPINVTISEDRYGMSMSIARCDLDDIMYVIPLEPIADRLIKLLRRHN